MSFDINTLIKTYGIETVSIEDTESESMVDFTSDSETITVDSVQYSFEDFNSKVVDGLYDVYVLNVHVGALSF